MDISLTEENNVTFCFNGKMLLIILFYLKWILLYWHIQLLFLVLFNSNIIIIISEAPGEGQMYLNKYS